MEVGGPHCAGTRLMSGIIDGFAALLSSAGASSWDHLVVQDGSRRPAIASQLQATTSSFCHFRMHPWAVYKDARPPQCESGRHLQTALLSFKSKNLRRIQTQTKSFPVTSLKAWPTSSLYLWIPEPAILGMVLRSRTK